MVRLFVHANRKFWAYHDMASRCEIWFGGLKSGDGLQQQTKKSGYGPTKESEKTSSKHPDGPYLFAGEIDPGEWQNALAVLQWAFGKDRVLPQPVTQSTASALQQAVSTMNISGDPDVMARAQKIGKDTNNPVSNADLDIDDIEAIAIPLSVALPSGEEDKAFAFIA